MAQISGGGRGRRVVITGLGAVSPLGVGVEALWQGALAGRSGIRQLTAFDASNHAATIGGQCWDFDYATFIDKRAANRMDRFVQLAVGSAHEALMDAGIVFGHEEIEGESLRVPTNIEPERFGCIYGCGIGGIDTFADQQTRLNEKGPRRVSAFTIPKIMTNGACGEISLLYGLKGPNSCVVTACASATHSIGTALDAIRMSRCDLVLTGGSEAAVTPIGVGGFCALKALSTRNDDPARASRPFEKNRDGFVIAEGAGAIVLEELEHALKRGARIYAELIGYGMTSDAYHITQPHPAADGAVRAISMALEDGGVDASMVDYISAHGTSTHFNDKVETLAIKKALGDQARKVAVNSAKSMIGHTLGASGGVEMTLVARSIYEKKVHPTINYETPDPECDLDYVPNEARDMEIRVALKNSLGFGGHNGTLAVARYEG